MDTRPALPKIATVDVVANHVLRLTFTDGVVGDVSFEDRGWSGVFAPLRDPATFARVQVDAQFHTLVWPGGLDMAPEPLYDAALQHPVAAGQSP